MNVPKTIQTPRLILRRHTPADLPAFTQFLQDGDATRYMAFTPEQRTPDGAKEMLDYVISTYDTEDAIFSLTIAHPDTNEYLGSCGLNPLPEEPENIELYYTILTRHQNQGYATEAARALVQHVFAETDYTQIIALVMQPNTPSIRVAQHLGFTDQGPVKRQAQTGDMSHEELEGRRYVLTRESIGFT